MNSEEYKHRGGEKADKVKNKKYARANKVFVNATTGSYMKSNAMRMSYMSRLNNPSEWNEFH